MLCSMHWISYIEFNGVSSIGWLIKELIMKIIEEKIGVMLIEKYGAKYIRFDGGEVSSRLYDLKITEEEAKSILDGKMTYLNVINKYSNSGQARSNRLIIAAVDDYLQNELGYDSKNSEEAIRKMIQELDIFYEFYDYVINEKFPKRGIEVEGYTAEKLYNTAKMSVFEAYNYLIYLRSNSKEALARLKTQ